MAPTAEKAPILVWRRRNDWTTHFFANRTRHGPAGNVRSSAGLGAMQLSEEAAILVAVHYGEKRCKSADLRVRFISVPLEIPAHPEYTPTVSRSNEGCLRNRVFELYFRMLPVATNLEYFHAVAGDSVTDIEVRANVRRRSPPLEKSFEIAFVTPSLDLGERHGSGQRSQVLHSWLAALHVGGSPQRDVDESPSSDSSF